MPAHCFSLISADALVDDRRLPPALGAHGRLRFGQRLAYGTDAASDLTCELLQGGMLTEVAPAQPIPVRQCGELATSGTCQTGARDAGGHQRPAHGVGVAAELGRDVADVD